MKKSDSEAVDDAEESPQTFFILKIFNELIDNFYFDLKMIEEIGKNLIED